MTSLGTGIAFLGAILAVGLACAGSGRGVGLAGEAGAGVIAEDPSKFAQCLILEIIPGTQGLYGLVIWFFAMMKMGFFATGVPDLSLSVGLQYFAACLPMGIGGYFTAIAQGRCAAAGVMAVARRGDQMAKGLIFAIMVEFYAILCLLASFLMLNSV